MYRKHFGLHDLPFRNTPDEDFFFGAAERKNIVEALEYVALRRDAIIKVVGEVGSGKTTLLRIVADRLQKDGLKVVYIPTPRLSAEEILRFIAKDLAISVDDADSKLDLYDRIYQFLLNVHDSFKGVVVLIDEAHTMPLDTLEEVRLLSNIETDKEKLLTVMLFGQPELDEMLERPEARQMRTRISHAFYLAPFSPDQVHEYLNFRMRRAGHNGDEVFDRKISKWIHKLTDGLPREVNNIADKLLLSAYSRNDLKIRMKDFKNSGFGLKERRFIAVFWVLILFFVLVGISYTGGKYFFDGLIVKINSDGEGSGDNVVGDAPSVGAQAGAGGMSRKSPEEGREDERNAGEYFSWDGNSLLVVLVTVECDDSRLVQNMLFELSVKDVTILKFDRDNIELCTFVTGPFGGLNAAQKYIDALPDKIKVNFPYAIEVDKFDRIFKERGAVLYENQ